MLDASLLSNSIISASFHKLLKFLSKCNKVRKIFVYDAIEEMPYFFHSAEPPSALREGTQATLHYTGLSPSWAANSALS
jgi:hypothetical protein